MAKKQTKSSCCMPDDGAMSCCRVEAMVSIDERGQMVLPKDLREKAKIASGDKFAVVPCELDGKICMIALIRMDELSGMVKDFLGPVMDEIVRK